MGHSIIYRVQGLHTKLVELIIQQSSRVKNNIQKLVMFIYTENEILERECKKKKSLLKLHKKITYE